MKNVLVKMRAFLITSICLILCAQTVWAYQTMNLSFEEKGQEIEVNAEIATDQQILSAGMLMAANDAELTLNTNGGKRIAFTQLNSNSGISLTVPNTDTVQDTAFRAYMIAVDENGNDSVYYSPQFTPAEYKESKNNITVDNVIYRRIDGGLEIAGVVNKVSEVTIPEKVEGQKVIKVADHAFEADTVLTSIDLPDTIQVIGKRAFASCSSLKTMK